MGYMRHHAIIVTSWDLDLLEKAHAKAVELGCSVTDIANVVINGYRSFLVAPDGSKEGWPESDEGDDRRKTLTEWLDSKRYDDDSTSLDWVEVQYGDEELHSYIVRDSDDAMRQARSGGRGNGGRHAAADPTEDASPVVTEWRETMRNIDQAQRSAFNKLT